MAERYTRDAFLKRLRGRLAARKPLVMTGAGNGIAAKFIERGGVDIIGVYNTGYFRMQGYGSLAGMLPMADANDLVYRTGTREILPQVKETPVIAGVNGVDVLRDMKLFLEDLSRSGFSGVHNFPTVGWFDGEFRNTLEKTGLGYGLEIDMLNLAHDLDLLTIGYAFNKTDTERLMKEAVVDIFIFHAGITRGGSTGYGESRSLSEMAEKSREQFEIAKSLKPDVILLAHGASLVEPEDARYMLAVTGCHGVQLGSDRVLYKQIREGELSSYKFYDRKRGILYWFDRDKKATQIVVFRPHGG